jgi:hypothetical protein
LCDSFSELEGISADVANIDDGLAELFGDFFSLTQDGQHVLEIGLDQSDVSEIFAIDQILLNKFFSGFE